MFVNMEIHDIGKIAAALPRLELATLRDEAEASASMHALGTFNQCTPGLVRFRGETPWERHPDSELLFVLDGWVDLTAYDADGVCETRRLVKGSLCVMPPALWHRQNAPEGATVLFVTSSDGNETSHAHPAGLAGIVPLPLPGFRESFDSKRNHRQ